MCGLDGDRHRARDRAHGNVDRRARLRRAVPALEPGKEYAYSLRAEIIRNGQTLVQTYQVVVRAGQETEVPIRFAEIALTRFE